MRPYESQQVCLNGHQIDNRYHECPQFRKKYCTQCGAATTHKCLSCETEIRGGWGAQVPWFCENCGRPFPWTENYWAEVKASKKNEINHCALVELICKRFHTIACLFRSRGRNRPPLEINDEYDVQYLLHALLRLTFSDIRSEEWTPSHAGASKRMDFLLKQEQIVIETKMTREGLDTKKLTEELVIDMAYYKTHPDCKILICFVYDPSNRIVNPLALQKDLSRQNKDLQVKVLVEPSLSG